MKLIPKPCPYCLELFQPRSATHLNCDKAGCQLRARERRAAMEKRRRRDREYKRCHRDRLVAVTADGKSKCPPGVRLCLKCDQPTKDGYICKNCKRGNAEIYVGVW